MDEYWSPLHYLARLDLVRCDTHVLAFGSQKKYGSLKCLYSLVVLFKQDPRLTRLPCIRLRAVQRRRRCCRRRHWNGFLWPQRCQKYLMFDLESLQVRYSRSVSRSFFVRRTRARFVTWSRRWLWLWVLVQIASPIPLRFIYHTLIEKNEKDAEENTDKLILLSPLMISEHQRIKHKHAQTWNTLHSKNHTTVTLLLPTLQLIYRPDV